MTMELALMDSKYNQFNEEEKTKIKLYASMLDENDSTSIITYGENLQKEIKEFTSERLSKTNSRDISRMNRNINELTTRLDESDLSDLDFKQGFFAKIFGKKQPSIYEVTAKYQRLSAQIEKLSIRLETNKDELLELNTLLDDIYEESVGNKKNLELLIAAGELKLHELYNETIPALEQELNANPDEILNQKLIDLSNYANRLEKRIFTLQQTSSFTVMQGTQVRMIQKTNQDLAEKIQVSTNLAIPIWLNQINLALTLVKQRQAAQSQAQAQKLTESILLENAENLAEGLKENQLALEQGKLDAKMMNKAKESLLETLKDAQEFQEKASLQFENVNDLDTGGSER